MNSSREPSLRVILRIRAGADRELYQALRACPPRERAARVRTLAAVGLSLARGRAAAPDAAPAEDPTPAPAPAPQATDAARQSLRARLLRSTHTPQGET